MRRAARTDANQQQIIKAFESLGWTVKDASRLGEGFPDLIVSRTGINLLIEVKDGSRCPSERKLTTAQQRFHKHWPGPLETVHSVDDVVAVNKRWRFILYNQRHQEFDGQRICQEAKAATT